jgi:RNA-directed DNA polymerase
MKRLIRRTAEEKMEIINLVEHSPFSVKKTLEKIQIPPSTFYRWYKLYQEDGFDGLVDKQPHARQFWNRIPDEVQQQVVDVALENTEESPRLLACRFVDEKGYFISESSVYRILKRENLLQDPAFEVISAKDEFDQKTKRVNEMWQTDFTEFVIKGWGKYYLCTVIDDYSRYVLAWRLSTTMMAKDAEATLRMALEKAGIEKVKVRYRPRLLSDNGSAFIAKDFAKFLGQHHIDHVRGRPYHPMTQGKIERWHLSLKCVINLDHYDFPWELLAAIAEYVPYYNEVRFHESIDNLTPADKYFGREMEVIEKRNLIKEQTLALRRQMHQQRVGVQL